MVELFKGRVASVFARDQGYNQEARCWSTAGMAGLWFFITFQTANFPLCFAVSRFFFFFSLPPECKSLRADGAFTYVVIYIFEVIYLVAKKW